jgi:hypothetical protein
MPETETWYEIQYFLSELSGWSSAATGGAKTLEDARERLAVFQSMKSAKGQIFRIVKKTTTWEVVEARR